MKKLLFVILLGIISFACKGQVYKMQRIKIGDDLGSHLSLLKYHFSESCDDNKIRMFNSGYKEIVFKEQYVKINETDSTCEYNFFNNDAIFNGKISSIEYKEIGGYKELDYKGKGIFSKELFQNNNKDFWTTQFPFRIIIISNDKEQYIYIYPYNIITNTLIGFNPKN